MRAAELMPRPIGSSPRRGGLANLGNADMNAVKRPASLRDHGVREASDGQSGYTVSAVAGLIAVATIGGAEAQQPSLPPVTVDAPIARARPANKPTPDQTRARTALRRAARQRAAQAK